MAVLLVSSANVIIFGIFKRRIASFRVAGMALCDIQTCFITCRKSFCVAGAIFLHRSPLEESCCVFFANRIVRAASSGDNVQIPWQAWHFVRCAAN